MNKKLAVILLSTGAIGANAYAADDDIHKLDDIVVISTGIKHSTAKSAKPVTVLTGDSLRMKTGTTIGDTLKNELGITSQSFGSGVGTPVIRGQSGPRVRVMQNSLGNNDVSSLSPDHANGVEPILVERIEVLRGPSTLLYGNGAIGGVVNVIDNRIPEQVPDKLIGGAGEQRYDSATNETSSAIKLEGGKSGVAYHVDGFYRDQGNTHIGGSAIDEEAARATDPGLNIVNNPNGLIDNSKARSRGGSVGVSKIGDAGLIGVSINSLEKNYGIPPDGSGGAPVTIDLTQTKYDFKGQLNKPFALAEELRMKFGYTDYKHVEMDNGTPATTFLNKSYESRLELEHKPIGILNGVLGFQSVNSQFAALGAEALVPRTDLDSYGLFDVESFKIGAVTYELGARGEWQTIAPENRNRLTYVPISGSASALWDITDRHQVSLAFTHSQRAPQIQELFSNGVHEATHSYELGNANLNKELSNNLDLGYRYKADWMTAELNLFHNWVGDYIYQQRTGDVFNRDSETMEAVCSAGASCVPVVASRQTAAIFKGFEAQTVFPLMQNRYGAIDLTLFGDYTRGTFEQGGNVPRMPPLRYGLQLSYEKNDWSTNARLTRGEAQNHSGEHDSNTPGYLLLNLGAQYRLVSFGDSEVLLFAKGKNILNENIRNSTSYLRNFAPEPGRSAELGIRVSY
ncbi:TonB-dependent receptor [Methylobacter sp.]|uniref:TonB-dependent receptor n=1 Tax=Methylobacter sp. TaxID=2051955 RepID=UPI0024883B8F|nr:TonB-dependent receptor [Methylobacter sp.]MDI1277044.1 TonB-dependent receptor [Methylobacter sp.]MDI1358824.1 TonB-dependent receptor [Methylobacter sp.]